MFTITIQGIGHYCGRWKFPTMVETLAEAETIALDRAERVLSLLTLELVYIEDLDYYVYSDDIRIARLTLQPIYAKVRTKQ